MAQWPENPEWVPARDINGGNTFLPADGLLYSDVNKIVQNLIYMQRRVASIPIMQEMGSSTTAAMSQKAVTKIFEDVGVTKNLAIFSAETLVWQENAELIDEITYANDGVTIIPSTKTKVNICYAFPTEVGKTYNVRIKAEKDTLSLVRLLIYKDVTSNITGLVNMTSVDGETYVGEITAQNEETYINLVTKYGTAQATVYSAWASEKEVNSFTSEFLARQKDVKIARENGKVIDEIVDASMSKLDFAASINSKFFDYAVLCKCHAESFAHITANMPWDEIYATLNKNFRREVCNPACSREYNCQCINAAFTVPVYRFQDAVLNDGAFFTDESNRETNVNASLRIPFTKGDGEPTALISPDGNEIWLYCGSKKVLKSTDGYHYTKKGDITLNKPVNDNGYVMHVNFSSVRDYLYDANGEVTGEAVKYYMIGATKHQVNLTVKGEFKSTENRDAPLYLYESDDGLNFNCLGKIFDTGLEYAYRKNLDNFGNSTLLKEGDVWYLLYEMQDRGYGTDFASEADYNNRLSKVRGWEICLATATDPFCPNEDGTIGNWVQCDKNPVIPYMGNKNYTNIVNYGERDTAWQDRSNPDFATRNNVPVKVDGKYYIYIHSETSTQIRRFYSYNLIDWVDEGVLLDVRDKPRAENPSNGDHTITEFRGRTFLFYTHNINGQDQSYMSMRLLVDDRPLNELLRLKP